MFSNRLKSDFIFVRAQSTFGTMTTISVVFCWLRNERSGKHFSHTRLGVWVRVCRGSSGHMAFQSSVVLLLSAIA